MNAPVLMRICLNDSPESAAVVGLVGEMVKA